MSSQTISLSVPDGLLARIRDRARTANRTVEAEALDVLDAGVPADTTLPPDLASAITALDLLDDAALRRAAASRLSESEAAELERLHLKQRRAGLNPAEDQARQDLIRHYERAMLVRARAIALLKSRGHDVSGLLAP